MTTITDEKPTARLVLTGKRPHVTHYSPSQQFIRERADAKKRKERIRQVRIAKIIHPFKKLKLKRPTWFNISKFYSHAHHR